MCENEAAEFHRRHEWIRGVIHFYNWTDMKLARRLVQILPPKFRLNSRIKFRKSIKKGPQQDGRRLVLYQVHMDSTVWDLVLYNNCTSIKPEYNTTTTKLSIHIFARWSRSRRIVSCRISPRSMLRPSHDISVKYILLIWKEIQLFVCQLNNMVE